MLRNVLRAYRDAFSGHGPAVWRLAIATLVNRSGTMVLPFLILFFTEERGFTAGEAGRMLALYGVGGLLGAFLGGWLCDRMAPRRVMIASLVLTGAGFLVLGYLEARWALAVTIFLVSLVGEAFRPANAAALAAASTPENRGRSFALNRLAVNVGMSFGPAVGGLLAQRDYGWLFLADGLTCLAAAGLLAAGPGLARAATAAVVTAASPRSPWRDGPFLVLLLLMTALGAVFFQTAGTFPLTLHELHGFSEAGIGLMLAVNTVVIVLFEMVLVHATRRIDPLLLVAVGSFFFCLGFGLLPLGSGFAWVAFTVVVWTVGEMLSMSAGSAVVANRAGSGSLGRYMGLYVLSFSAAQVIAPVAGTWVYERFGPDTLWYVCGALGVPIALGFAALAPAWRRGAETAATARAAA
ncbi:MAG TPA: MFS transporter [Thermoanaerobaculia bacterium]|nr:MFS transporter [Thermoanaerobaculia bacterium]